MKYKTITYITSNENGDREIKFEMHRTLLDRLLFRPGRTRVFVNPKRFPFFDWFDKKTGWSAGLYWDVECLNVLKEHKTLMNNP